MEQSLIIDIGYLAKWAVALIAIATLCGGVTGFFYKQCKKVENLGIIQKQHAVDILESKHERKLIIESQRTILEVVARGENNGNVDEQMDKINCFLNDSTHK